MKSYLSALHEEHFLLYMLVEDTTIITNSNFLFMGPPQPHPNPNPNPNATQQIPGQPMAKSKMLPKRRSATFFRPLALKSGILDFFFFIITLNCLTTERHLCSLWLRKLNILLQWVLLCLTLCCLSCFHCMVRFGAVKPHLPPKAKWRAFIVVRWRKCACANCNAALMSNVVL